MIKSALILGMCAMSGISMSPQGGENGAGEHSYDQDIPLATCSKEVVSDIEFKGDNYLDPKTGTQATQK